MDCPSNEIHDIKCPTNKNDFTVTQNWSPFVKAKFAVYMRHDGQMGAVLEDWTYLR